MCHQGIAGVHVTHRDLPVDDKSLRAGACARRPRCQLRAQVKHAIPCLRHGSRVDEATHLARVRRDDHVPPGDLGPRRGRVPNLLAPGGQVRLAQHEAGCRHRTLDLDGDSSEVGVDRHLNVDQAAEGVGDEGRGRRDSEAAADLGHTRPLAPTPDPVAVGSDAHVEAPGRAYFVGHRHRHWLARCGVQASGMPARHRGVDRDAAGETRRVDRHESREVRGRRMRAHGLGRSATLLVHEDVRSRDGRPHRRCSPDAGPKASGRSLGCSRSAVPGAVRAAGHPEAGSLRCARECRGLGRPPVASGCVHRPRAPRPPRAPCPHASERGEHRLRSPPAMCGGASRRATGCRWARAGGCRRSR